MPTSVGRDAFCVVEFVVPYESTMCDVMLVVETYTLVNVSDVTVTALLVGSKSVAFRSGPVQRTPEKRSLTRDGDADDSESGERVSVTTSESSSCCSPYCIAKPPAASVHVIGSGTMGVLPSGVADGRGGADGCAGVAGGVTDSTGLLDGFSVTTSSHSPWQQKSPASVMDIARRVGFAIGAIA